MQFTRQGIVSFQRMKHADPRRLSGRQSLIATACACLLYALSASRPARSTPACLSVDPS